LRIEEERATSSATAGPCGMTTRKAKTRARSIKVRD